MPGGFDLDWKREVAPPDAGQQFFASLDGPLGPAMLLRLETVHIHRQLGRSDHVGQINKFPARELRAIAKIQIFGSVKKWIVRFSKSFSGTKSASRIQRNSPSAAARPVASAPALKPVRSTR